MAIRSPVQRILVMDSDPAIRDRLRKVLRGAGYEVVSEANGPIDLVIASLSTTEDELRAIRADRPRLRMIAMAAAFDDSTLRAADLLGAQAVVTKQTSSSVLLGRVRELLRSRPVPYVSDEERKAFYSIRGMPH